LTLGDQDVAIVCVCVAPSELGVQGTDRTV
jgi:hypothetical protein